MSISTIVATLFGLGIFFVLLIVALLIVFYVFSSLSYYTMANNRGIDNAWMAWIPIVNLWLKGQLVDDFVLMGEKRLDHASITLLALSILSIALSSVNVLGTIIYICSWVYNLLFQYRLYKLYKPESAILFLVLGIVFPIVTPFFLFSIRNNEPHEYYADAAEM